MAQAHLIRINLDSPVPAYRQIVDSIRVLLVERALAPGDALPSIRRVAIDLGVHFNTVAQAYRQLAVEGWLGLQQGKRVVVVQRSTTAAKSTEALTYFQERLRSLVAESRSAGVTNRQIAAELRSIEEELKP